MSLPESSITKVGLRLFWGLWPRKTLSISVKGDDVVEVVLRKHPLAHYNVGSYIFLNFPGISFLQFHPFTLSSGPYEETLTVHIKVLGGHTQELYDKVKANEKDYMWARIDGPYGHFSFNYKKYPVLILTCGGIGITPLLSLIRTVYRIDVPEEEQIKHPLSSVIKHIHFLWVVKDLKSYQWFSDELEEIRKKATLSQFPKFYHSTFITRSAHAKSSTANPPVGKPKNPFFSLHTGSRPNLSEYFSHIRSQTSARVGVVTCGPSGLVKSTWDETSKANRLGSSFDFHHETFQF